MHCMRVKTIHPIVYHDLCTDGIYACQGHTPDRVLCLVFCPALWVSRAYTRSCTLTCTSIESMVVKTIHSIVYSALRSASTYGCQPSVPHRVNPLASRAPGWVSSLVPRSCTERTFEPIERLCEVAYGATCCVLRNVEHLFVCCVWRALLRMARLRTRVRLLRMARAVASCATSNTCSPPPSPLCPPPCRGPAPRRVPYH